MEEKDRTPCDPDDLICQMETLRHLQGLETQMGNEAFLEKYPELAAAKSKISADVIGQQGVVDHALEGCAGTAGDPEHEGLTQPSAEASDEESL